MGSRPRMTHGNYSTNCQKRRNGRHWRQSDNGENEQDRHAKSPGKHVSKHSGCPRGTTPSTLFYSLALESGPHEGQIDILFVRMKRAYIHVLYLIVNYDIAWNAPSSSGTFGGMKTEFLSRVFACSNSAHNYTSHTLFRCVLPSL